MRKISKYLKRSGKWGYGPYQSDVACDYAWNLEIELMQKILEKLSTPNRSAGDGFEESMVILDLLSHIKNDSVDKAKQLWQTIDLIFKSEIEKWSQPHENSYDAKSTLIDLLATIDKRIMHGVY